MLSAAARPPATAHILVTGGTGTFGQAFARMVLTRQPATCLTLVSRSEYAQVLARRQFATETHRVTFALGDVRDLARMQALCQGQDVVVHAAALKHIAIGEESPQEVIATNILGTQNVIQAAQYAGVPRVVVLSSDKAVDPANLYGCTKMAAERLALVAARLAPQMRVNVTRYGNVMGSRGSVLEVFQRLLAHGQRRLPVTDLSMTRFFMLIEEAVELVWHALQQPVSGYLFVPRLPAFSLDALVKVLLAKDTLEIDTDYTLLGMQPGEKRHEALLTEAEHARAFTDTQGYAIAPSWGGHGALPDCWHPCSFGSAYQSGEARLQMSLATLRDRLTPVLEMPA